MAADKTSLFDLIDQEYKAANEYYDRKEAEIDKYGYGRPPGYEPGQIVGLGSFTPRTRP